MTVTAVHGMIAEEGGIASEQENVNKSTSSPPRLLLPAK
jgi:hypothetical protein